MTRCARAPAPLQVLYYTSAVGVVYDAAENRQRFYVGHEDEISCLALHPDRDTVATGGVVRLPASPPLACPSACLPPLACPSACLYGA